jgi:hypothetical protein
MASCVGHDGSGGLCALRCPAAWDCQQIPTQHVARASPEYRADTGPGLAERAWLGLLLAKRRRVASRDEAHAWDEKQKRHLGLPLSMQSRSRQGRPDHHVI